MIVAHIAHAAIVVAGAVVLVALLWPGRLVPGRTGLVLTSAGASVGAAWVHAAVTGEHWAESSLIGGFFLAAAVAQTAWAIVAVRHPSSQVLLAGALGNVAIVGLWLASRLVALPYVGAREPVGASDLLATGNELAVVFCCVAALCSRAVDGPAPAGSVRAARRGIVFTPVVTALLVLAGPAL